MTTQQEAREALYSADEVDEAMEVLRGRQGSSALLREVLDDMERVLRSAIDQHPASTQPDGERTPGPAAVPDAVPDDVVERALDAYMQTVFGDLVTGHHNYRVFREQGQPGIRAALTAAFPVLTDKLDGQAREIRHWRECFTAADGDAKEAERKLAAAERERDLFARQRDREHELAKRFAREAEALRNENAGLREDAQRYRWIREWCNEGRMEAFGFGFALNCDEPESCWDATIDAARAATKD